MNHELKQDLSVITADDYQLGQTHTLYHRQGPAYPERNLYSTYLMVVNMTIGDEYYVPTVFIDETRDDATAVWLTLSRDEINKMQLTRLPQFVADDEFTEEKLGDAANAPDKGKPYEDVMPLPPNLSSKGAE